VAQCAYGVQIGEAEASFERIVLGNTLLPASAGALRQLPRRSAGAVARRILPALASARAARALAEPVFRLRGRREASTELALCRMKNILVVRLDEIGDVVLTSPFLRELRRGAPAAHITLVVKPGTRNLVERCPHVDEVLTFDGSARGRLAALEVRARTWKMARKELWPQRFDLAILPRWDADYTHATFLAYFSGAAARIGFSENVNRVKQQINRGNDQLLTHALYDHAAKHEVEHNLDVLRALGGEVRDTRLELWLAPEDEAFAEATLAARSAGARLVAFGVGAGARKRRWPVSRFVEVGRRLCGEGPTRIVVVGGAEDGLAAEKLERELGIAVINLTGKATLRQTAATLKRCDLFIGNDAGPMHLAAAAGVPVIEICCQHRGGSPLDANSPVRFGPWGVESVVLQPERPGGTCAETCLAGMPHCILGVSPKHVQQAIARVSRQARAGVAGKR
jgi:ADP-heptose:LPS heptosyltransferase